MWPFVHGVAKRPAGLRDAIHLASALEVEQLTGSTPSFCCFDDRLREAASAEGLPVPCATGAPYSQGQVKGLQVKAQLTSPTSHCAIPSASPILQLPSLLTSHTSGWVKGP